MVRETLEDREERKDSGKDKFGKKTRKGSRGDKKRSEGGRRGGRKRLERGGRKKRR